MIKTIIFDLWNTLARKEVRFSRAFRDHFRIEDTDFQRRFEIATQLKRWGTVEDMAINLLFSFDIPMTDRNIWFCRRLINRSCRTSSLIDGASSLLRKLNKRHDLVLLSNTNNFETLKKGWEITGLFSSINYSYELGRLKPESLESLFEGDRTCSSQNQRPNPSPNPSPTNCMLIDDSHENVQMAKKLGMKAIRFDTIEGLHKKLKAQGMI